LAVGFQGKITDQGRSIVAKITLADSRLSTGTTFASDISVACAGFDAFGHQRGFGT
jgi:hypothetical protein